MTPTLSPLLTDSLRLLGAKRQMLRRDAAGLRTLAIGSSQGDFGFDPGFYPGSFNLCCRSQDLRHSYHLYHRLAPQCPQLEHVIVFYSVFSPGHVMAHSPNERDICVALNELFDLGITYGDAHLDELCQALRGTLGDVAPELDGRHGFLPHDGKDFMPGEPGVAQRVASHLKRARGAEGNLDLLRLLLLARHRGHRVTIAIPPVRSDYFNATHRPSEQIFHGLLEIVHDFHLDMDVRLHDFYDSGLFEDAWFGDFDHLRPLGEGTRLLSQMLHAVDAP